jgi:AraC-like DNA-binding protein
MPVAPETARAVNEGLSRLGVDVLRLGVGRIDSDQALATLWSRAVRSTGRATLPLEVGCAMPLGSMGLIDYLASSSATIGAALTVTQQSFSLVAPGVQLLLNPTREGSWRVVIVNHPRFPGERASDLLVVGILRARLLELASRALDMPRIELTMPGPALRSAWSDLLKGVSVRFGARRSVIHLSAADWKVPLRNPDARLQQTLRKMLDPLGGTPDALLVAVRALVLQSLPSLVEVGFVAKCLGMSSRTLQRKLSTSETTFVQLLDEIRHDQAAERMCRSGLKIGEIARSVGYTEPASFCRAWRRWRGEAPSVSRQHLRMT